MVLEKPHDKDKKDLEKDNFPLELKDWIVFLNSESYQYAEIGLLFFTIVIALYAIISIENYIPLLQWVAIILMMTLIALAALIINHGLNVKNAWIK